MGARVCMHCGHRFTPVWVKLVGVGVAIAAFGTYWFYMREPISRWLGW